jgi:hypothetical protein
LERWELAEKSRFITDGSFAVSGMKSGRAEPRKLSQEDMISYGFSVRHWQMMEAGRPITVITLLRVCEAFDIPVEKLVASVAHHLRKGKKSTSEGPEIPSK